MISDPLELITRFNYFFQIIETEKYNTLSAWSIVYSPWPERFFKKPTQLLAEVLPFLDRRLTICYKHSGINWMAACRFKAAQIHWKKDK